MRIVIGSDHAGFELKEALQQWLHEAGHEVIDVGTDSDASCDYPVFGAAVAREVAAGDADRGVAVCGSGLGICMAANKIPGVRAATCHDEVTAEMSRRHNDLNVLCLSAEMIGPELQEKMLRTWLETPFEGGRHARRVAKIAALEPDCSEK